MKRTLSVVAVLVAFAATANAASLSIVSDKTTYAVGETITLTVTGDDTGGGQVYGIYGRLLYNAAATTEGTRTQTPLTGVSGKWTSGSLEASDGISEAFDAISLYANDAAQLPGVLSTVTLIASALGVVNVDWDISSPGLQLDFFGLTNAPGTSFTIVPEPTTVALLGLGFVGLALAGRRRS